MKNLEQIRAKNAFEAANNKAKYEFAGVNGGKAVAKKIPTQIRENGFLGAMAFAIETGKGYKAVFEAIIEHLADVKCNFGIAETAPENFFRELSQKDADVLRTVTAEAMAYLNYLRRFAKGEKEEKDE